MSNPDLPIQPALPLSGREGPTYLAYQAGTEPAVARALYFKTIGIEADQVIINSGAVLVGPIPQEVVDKRKEVG